MQLQLDREYGWVLLVLGSSWMLNGWLTVSVQIARKRFGIKYPQMYATPDQKNAEAFNCVQRAHQNTHESLYGVQILVRNRVSCSQPECEIKSCFAPSVDVGEWRVFSAAVSRARANLGRNTLHVWLWLCQSRAKGTAAWHLPVLAWHISADWVDFCQRGVPAR